MSEYNIIRLAAEVFYRVSDLLSRVYSQWRLRHERLIEALFHSSQKCGRSPDAGDWGSAGV